MNNTTEKSSIFNEECINHVFNADITNEVFFDLQKRGFNYLFKLKEECISCKDYNIGFEEFDIIEVHTIKTASPGKHHVIYVIKCNRYNIQGIIVTPFENYANTFLNVCLNKILNNEKLRFEYYNN